MEDPEEKQKTPEYFTNSCSTTNRNTSRPLLDVFDEQVTDFCANLPTFHCKLLCCHLIGGEIFFRLHKTQIFTFHVYDSVIFCFVQMLSNRWITYSTLTWHQRGGGDERVIVYPGNSHALHSLKRPPSESSQTTDHQADDTAACPAFPLLGYTLVQHLVKKNSLSPHRTKAYSYRIFFSRIRESAPKNFSDPRKRRGGDP